MPHICLILKLILKQLFKSRKFQFKPFTSYIEDKDKPLVIFSDL